MESSFNFKPMESRRVDSKQQYLMRRLAQEDAAAIAASDPGVRDLHLEMARRYRHAHGDGDGAAGADIPPPA